MRIRFVLDNLESYRTFLKVKRCPSYSWQGREAIVPDEYAADFGAPAPKSKESYKPAPFLFDYQRDIAALAIRKRKFAVFAECGLGKSLIILEFARHAMHSENGRILIVSPLMVVRQTMAEARRFYGDELQLEQIEASRLQSWMDGDGAAIGITNYEAIRDGLRRGNVRGLILDESSMLKNAYGKWGVRLIELGQGLNWKLCATGTPAPNDRIEFGNHAVFLDAFSSVHAFLATYFVNRGQTDNRWELRRHALKPFYRDLSHWCIFLTHPAVYGWRDNVDGIPPIHVHIERIALTDEQTDAMRTETGQLFVTSLGGIATRARLSRLAKGHFNGERIATNKPAFIRDLVESFGDESRIVWCHYNSEQDGMDDVLGVREGRAVSIRGETPTEERYAALAKFQSGEVKTLISKPKVLGFGLNLQIATRQVFSGVKDSYEEFHQAIKRSNRIGSDKPLNVHVPVTELEEPMLRNVLVKRDRVEADTREQEHLFREHSYDFGGTCGR